MIISFGIEVQDNMFAKLINICPKGSLPNPSREVNGDTVMFRDAQIGSSAVYQCNASNEHGYLLANAFVSILGEHYTR